MAYNHEPLSQQYDIKCLWILGCLSDSTLPGQGFLQGPLNNILSPHTLPTDDELWWTDGLEILGEGDSWRNAKKSLEKQSSGCFMLLQDPNVSECSLDQESP